MRPLSAALLLLLLSSAQLQAQIAETITVARVVLDVRVTARDGTAVRDLKPEDFIVEIDGKRVAVESAEWIEETEAGRLVQQPREGEELVSHRPAGRMLVVFIQTDFARNETRTRGQMNFLRYAETFVEELAAEDRVAVFSFDSHLKFRLDFTSDKSAVAAAMREALRTDIPPPPPVVPNPSLASRLDRQAMKKTASSEAALTLIGNALRHIEGPKSLLLMGWGLGVLSNGMVRMKPEYKFARQALDAARTSIFALDTSHADYHSLEVGLQQAADDTGGFYAKTHIFPQIAVDRLHRVLEGHYELEIRAPEKSRSRAITIRVRRRGVDVLAPAFY